MFSVKYQGTIKNKNKKKNNNYKKRAKFSNWNCLNIIKEITNILYKVLLNY